MPADQGRDPIRHGAMLLAVLLASCTPAVPEPPLLRGVAAQGPAACQVGADDGPSTPVSRISDRGIGGTGAPARQAGRGLDGAGAAKPQLSDRGIGGTGAPMRQANRGPGNTGIVAVITGFASVCLAGQEVALDPEVSVLIEGQPALQADLRAGQVVLVDAVSEDRALRARAIKVRYEVSGRVDAANGSMLRVAGQQVVVPAGVRGAQPVVGDWVAVSGLRRPDGVIEATRLDRRAPGAVIVHGHLVRKGGQSSIGSLPVRLLADLSVPHGRDVTVVGVLDAGVLRAEQLTPDLLASDPTALFGAGISELLVEAFIVSESGSIRFGQGFSTPAPGLGAVVPGRSVVALELDASGLRAVGVDQTGHAGVRDHSAAPPAPALNRAAGPPDPGRPGSLNGPIGIGEHTSGHPDQAGPGRASNGSGAGPASGPGGPGPGGGPGNGPGGGPGNGPGGGPGNGPGGGPGNGPGGGPGR